MVHYVSGVTIYDTDEEQESTSEVHTLDICVPLLVRPCGLVKTPLPGVWLAFVPSVNKTSRLQNPVSRCRTDSYNVIIQHHVCESSVSFLKMILCILYYGLPLPW